MSGGHCIPATSDEMQRLVASMGIDALVEHVFKITSNEVLVEAHGITPDLDIPTIVVDNSGGSSVVESKKGS